MPSFISHSHPLSVGTLHSPSCLDRLMKGDCWALINKLDFLEVRLDGMKRALLPQKWPRPMIATARHPAEGGAGDLQCLERRELLEKAISWASAIDVELSFFNEFEETIAWARAAGGLIIASFHDFESVPSFAELEKMLLQAKEKGVDVLKIVATPHTKEELQRLLLFQKKSFSSPVRVATMGMGELGIRSRLLLVEAGSALMYGWVYHPQVTGQWSAEEMLSKQLMSND
ncbi:MAG: type I 3-dehydroquinate dehydratase [Chthoniobacterales bacterium]|nr:type I 3-dehydroquinate dehydratase [Chthoniobacterales bacterium]